jgi:hypothetical protein
MSESTMLWVLGGMQALTLFLLGWIKIDIKELWQRADTHGHDIECDASGCKPKTTAVILHEAGK